MRHYLNVDTAIILAAFALAIGFWTVGSLISRENKEWEAFKVEHNCKVVQHTRGSTVVGTGVVISPNGQIGVVPTITSTPSKTAWACDDGITYWR